MNVTLTNSIEKLTKQKPLTHREFVAFLKGNSPQLRKILSEKANLVRYRNFGNRIYIRGLIEFSNYCKNDCLYCGIRHSNLQVHRYRLTKDDILSCCQQGYHLGFRTFVLQSGEDPYFTDERMTDIVSSIHKAYPDCAITLSLGERSKKVWIDFSKPEQTAIFSVMKQQMKCTIVYSILIPCLFITACSV